MPFRLPDRAPDFVRGLPTPPLGLLRPVFQQLMAGLLRRHPEMFDRLGEYGQVNFLIDPVDLPIVFIMRPDTERPLLTPHGRDAIPEWGAAVRGPLPRLISMVNGREDGDALFFSRDIVIEGDTEAVLALRNAIDDANIDLFEEITALLGPFGRLLASLRVQVEPLFGRVAAVARRGMEAGTAGPTEGRKA